MNRRPLSQRCTPDSFARLLLSSGLALACTLASAQSSPYYIGVAQTIGYNSNIIALRDSQLAPVGLSKSDTVFSTALVAGIDQPFGRQRLAGTANLNFNRYSRNNDFNSRGHTLRLGLDWQTVERLSGRVALSSDRSLRADVRDPNDQFILRSNAETANALDTTFSVGLVTRLSAEAGFQLRDVRYSAAEAAFREYKQRSASLGLRWRPASSTTWGLGLRQTRWDYPNLLIGLPDPNDRRTRDDVDASVSWQVSGISSLDIRLSSGDTKYQQFDNRNFSGLTGSLGWDWQPSGKLRVNTRLSRDDGQDADRTTTAYTRTTDLLRVGVDYALSAKISVNGGVTLYSRLVEGRGGNVASFRGRENGNTLALGVRWAPVRSTTVGCNVTSDRLGANDNPVLNDKYGASGLSCFGQFVLQ